MRKPLTRATLALLIGANLVASAPVKQSEAPGHNSGESQMLEARGPGSWSGTKLMAVTATLLGVPGMFGYTVANYYGSKNLALSNKIIKQQRLNKIAEDRRAREDSAKLQGYLASLETDKSARPGFQGSARETAWDVSKTGSSGGSTRALSKRDLEDSKPSELTARSSPFVQWLSAVGLTGAAVNLLLASHGAVNNIESYRNARTISRLNGRSDTGDEIRAKNSNVTFVRDHA